MWGRAAQVGMLVLAAAVVLYVRARPLFLDGVPQSRRAELTFRGDDGREHVYLGDYDSYLWVREARNYLRSGTTCDAVVEGRCRDTLTNAPVGADMRYARSLHVAAIVAMHRLIALLAPGYPLTSSAFWVPVVVGVLGVLPAFAIGARLAGSVGGLVAAIVVGVNPLFIVRSVGSDNDVWNVVLPLFAVWPAMAALEAASRARAVVLAAIAGAVVGLHAATWSGWGFTHLVLLAGLGAAAVIEALDRSTAPERGVAARLVLPIYWLAAAAATGIAGAGVEALVKPFAVLMAPWAAATALTDAPWPDTFTSVGELSRSSLEEVGNLFFGDVPFFLGCVGLLLTVLPTRRWRAAHVAVLVVGALVYAGVLAVPDQRREALVGLLALPLGGALAVHVVRPAALGSPAGAWIVAVWFLAGMYEALAAQRLLLLLVAPFGLALGVAMGRLHTSVVDALRPYVGRYAWLAWATLLVLPGAVVVRCTHAGMAAARACVPQMNDAWWDTLVRLRDSTPPDAIVSAWWDNGHWIKYVAERRVNVDGSTLGTHVPHWLARALLAPTDDEAAGLLRMLACGSDATPEPEGKLGAWGKLVAHGMDPATAHETIVALARLDRATARLELLAQGLDPEAADDVLMATHCTPPPIYLVLGSALAGRRSWRALGAWDPRRPRTGDDGDAHAGALQWMPCTSTADGAWACRANPPGSAPTARPAVAYRPDGPGSTRLVTPTGETVPAAVLLARSDRVEEETVAGADEGALGVLIDVPGRRALVDSPAMLRSTFTRLMFLGAHYTPHFELVDDRTSPGAERVRVWKVW